MDSAHVVRWWSPRIFLPIWPPIGGQISWPPEMILAPGGYQQTVARFGGIDAPIFFGSQADKQTSG